MISAYLGARFHDDPDVRRRVGQLHELEREIHGAADGRKDHAPH